MYDSESKRCLESMRMTWTKDVHWWWDVATVLNASSRLRATGRGHMIYITYKYNFGRKRLLNCVRTFSLIPGSSLPESDMFNHQDCGS